MTITEQDARMILNMIENSSISGKAIEIFSEFKGRVIEFLATLPEEITPEVA